MTVKRRPSNSIRGGSAAGFLAVLALAVVGGGLYLASKNPEPLPVKVKVTREDNLTQVAALARVEKDAEWLQRAIRERQAIIGMSFREVEAAKGRPASKQRGDSLTEADLNRGGVEKWTFSADGRESGAVLFGKNGLVIYSTDVGDIPSPGQVIRQ